MNKKTLPGLLLLGFLILVVLNTSNISPTSFHLGDITGTSELAIRQDLSGVDSFTPQVIANGSTNGINYMAQLENYGAIGETGNWSDSWNVSDISSYNYTVTYPDIYLYTQYNISFWYYWYNYTYSDLLGSIDSQGWAFYNTTDPLYGTFGGPNYPTSDPYGSPLTSADFGSPLETMKSFAQSNGFTIYQTFTEYSVYDFVYGDYFGDINVTDYWEANYTAVSGDEYYYYYYFYFAEPHTNGVLTSVNVTYTDTYNYSSIGAYNYSYNLNFTDSIYSVYVWNDVIDFFYSSYLYSSYNYSDSGQWYEKYSYNWNSTVAATFAENTTIGTTAYTAGSVLPFTPDWAQPYSGYSIGEWNETYSSTGKFKSSAALQSFFFAMTTTQANGTNFALWSVFAPGNLIAYHDRNENRGLDFRYSPENGVEVDGDDIDAWGIPEAYQDNFTYTFAYNNKYNYSETSYGATYSDNVTDLTSGSYSSSYSIGDPNTPFSTNHIWKTPATVGNTTTFNFGIEYINFPVSWFNTTAFNGVVPMNITYSYSLVANPFDSGTYDLITSLYFSPIDNMTAIGVPPGASLATVAGMSFYTTAPVDLTAPENAAAQTDEVNATVDNKSIASVDFAGTKQEYILIGTPNQSLPVTASAVTLFSQKGKSDVNQTETFSSETTDKSEEATEEQGLSYGNPAYSYEYTESLIVISFNTWDGAGIFWDPTYSAVAAVSANKPATTTTATTTTSGQTSSATTPTSIATSVPSQTTGAPGFELLAVIGMVISVGVFRRGANKKD